MRIPLLAFSLPDYFYFVFGVCVFVSACIVLFYAKRHPNPHFRPKKSDIGLVSFILLFASAGVAFLTSGAFDLDVNKEKLEKQMKDAERMAALKGTTVEEELGLSEGDGESGSGGSEDGGGSSNLPDDVPEELREAIEGK